MGDHHAVGRSAVSLRGTRRLLADTGLNRLQTSIRCRQTIPCTSGASGNSGIPHPSRRDRDTAKHLRMPVSRGTRCRAYTGVTIDKDGMGEPTGVFRESNSVPAVEHSLMKVLPRASPRTSGYTGIRRRCRCTTPREPPASYEGTRRGLRSRARAYKELWADGDMTVRSTLVISPLTRLGLNKSERP
jgi:hypothetical protein